MGLMETILSYRRSLSILFILLVGFPDSLLLPTNPELEDVASVSGLYGPGTTLAWLITVLSNTEFQVLAYLLRGIAFRRTAIDLPKSWTEGKLDATLVTSAVFSTIAAVDCVSHHMRVPWYEFSDVHASEAIVSLSQATSLLALLVQGFGIELTLQQRIRLSVWSYTWLISTVTSTAFTWRSGWVGIAILRMDLVNIRGLMRLFSLFYSPAILLMAQVVWYIACSILFLQEQPPAPDWPKSSWRFAFPKSGIGLKDLDQAATLGAALCIVGLSVVRTGWSWKRCDGRQNIEDPEIPTQKLLASRVEWFLWRDTEPLVVTPEEHMLEQEA
ncbi:hypothetical protein H2198_007291 [Neophaeococcomyces mojaviensis]|uniref:Uncharacterized protein n=1 Tax=Neophaeococcomyces mojaviensis TaxID=3383035 RepID=A0ACC3A0T7_9EURO|nr:hypothetical protein H2198_007291 [Knufia sp. JES_112]